ncbi:CBS domain-containing protein [Ectobacillus ponti]|uniref:CBS domain-containing protein n=1 Tax=Ectobacillus ponti TaxID=2961894 RepID=A0AA41XA33_9BACI|nr:CBS domain-containing protein [Ectobacillus ponti]MCP8969499.1 CBS domain-containing protein [Ectobacillus ponti]
MQAHEIMNTEVFKVTEKDSVRAVIEKFIEKGISGMPVVNDRNKIVGYISDGDIMRHIGKHKDIVIDGFYFINIIVGDEDEYEERARKTLDLNVMQVAKRNVLTVAWNEDAENVAAILGKKHIKKLPVERNGVLAGIISRGDVIRTSFKHLL